MLELLVGIVWWGAVASVIGALLFVMLCMVVICWDVMVAWAEDWYYDRRGRK